MSKDKRKTATPQEKIKVNDIFFMVADVINNEMRDVNKWPDFGRKLFAIRNRETLLAAEELENGVVRYVDLLDVAQSIVRYLSQDVNNPFYYLNYDQAFNCAKTWLAIAKVRPMPEPVLWKNQPGLTFSRLPWDYCEDMPCHFPTFQEWMERTTNAEAFCEWVGSLFIKESDRQQYVWLCSEGGTGKGAMLRFIRKIFADAFAAKQVPGKDDKHWTHGLMGKRIIAFPDSNNAAFVMTGLFKNLTGDDPVDINPKHQKAFTADLNCKFIFLSNRRPEIQDLMADRRRLILCEMSDPGELTVKEKSNYNEKLWAEGGAFLRYCINKYKSNHPSDFGPITVCGEGVKTLLDEKYEEFDVVFEANFELSKNDSVTAGDMISRLNCTRFDQRKRKEFLDYFFKKYGIYRDRATGGGRIYRGIKLRVYHNPNHIEFKI